VTKYRRELIEKQDGVCPLCNGGRGPLLDQGRHTKVDHITPVKSFAHDLTIPLTEAFVKCNEDINNLRAVHWDCHKDRNHDE